MSATTKTRFRFWQSVAVVVVGTLCGLLGAFVAAVPVWREVVAASISGSPISVVAALVVQLGFEVAFIVPMLLLVKPWCGVSLAALGFTLPRRPDVLLGIGVGFGASIVINVLMWSLDPRGHHTEQAVRLFQNAQTVGDVALFAAFAILIGPVAEEIVFRAFIGRWISSRGGPVVGGCISAILFGLAHGDIWNALPLAAAGGILWWLYWRTKNIYVSMIAHAVFNAVPVCAMIGAALVNVNRG